MIDIHLNMTSEDDPDFVQIIKKIVDSVVIQYNPKAVCVVQIDNWFDHKWLGFSGKFLGGIGIWKKKLTLPPFNPNRVKHQIGYQLSDEGQYQQAEIPAIHVWQQSDQNFNRKISELTDSGLFAWYSGNTNKNGKGSLMIYSQVDGNSDSWYVSFEKNGVWGLNKTKGITLDTVKEYIA